MKTFGRGMSSHDSFTAMVLIFLLCGVCAAQGVATGTPAAKSKLTTATKKTVFKVRGMGELETDYHIRMGFSSYVAPDGVGVVVLYLAENDHEQAAEAFKQEFARATKTSKIVETKDRSGKVIGQRAEILTPHYDGQDSAVIRTDGPTFHMFVSSSIKDALALERVY